MRVVWHVGAAFVSLLLLLTTNAAGQGVPDTERELVVSLVKQSWEAFQLPVETRLSQDIFTDPSSTTPLLSEARAACPEPLLEQKTTYRTVTKGNDFGYTECDVDYAQNDGAGRADTRYSLKLRWCDGKSKRLHVNERDHFARAVVSAERPAELNMGHSPKHMIEGPFEFLGLPSVLSHPNVKVTRETDDHGESLYVFKLTLEGDETETYWVKSDRKTAIAIRGRSRMPGVKEASYEVLATAKATVNGAPVEYPVKVEWENASTQGYHKWVTEMGEVTWLDHFSPGDYDFEIPPGATVQDLLSNIHYRAGSQPKQDEGTEAAPLSSQLADVVSPPGSTPSAGEPSAKAPETVRNPANSRDERNATTFFLTARGPAIVVLAAASIMALAYIIMRLRSRAGKRP